MPRNANDQAWRVTAFQNATGEGLDVAVAYLEAEEWGVLEALASYRADQRAHATRTPIADLNAYTPFIAAVQPPFLGDWQLAEGAAMDAPEYHPSGAHQCWRGTVITGVHIRSAFHFAG